MSSNPAFMLLLFGPDGRITTDIGLTLKTEAGTVILGPGGAIFGSDARAVAGSYANTGNLVSEESLVAVSGNFEVFVASVAVQVSGATASGTITLDAPITADICLGNDESFVVVVPAGQTSGTFSIEPPSAGTPLELDHRKLLAKFSAGLKTLKRGAR